MTCVLCVTGGKRAETKDRYYLYHNAISRKFQKGNLVRNISDQMVLPTDIFHGKSKFYAFLCRDDVWK